MAQFSAGRSLGRARAAKRERERKALASIRFAAMGRLQGAVIQLRDLLIELPTDALAALGDRTKFDHVKASGVRKVQGLYESWAPDARIVGVESHFELLASATKRAVYEFPYPDQVFVSPADIKQGLVSLWSAGASAVRAGGSALGAVRQEAESELEVRVRAIQEQYLSWWAKHSVELRRSTVELQSALGTAAVNLGMEVTAT